MKFEVRLSILKQSNGQRISVRPRHSGPLRSGARMGCATRWLHHVAAKSANYPVLLWRLDNNDSVCSECIHWWFLFGHL